MLPQIDIILIAFMLGCFYYLFSLSYLAFLIVVDSENLRPQDKLGLVLFSQLTVLVGGKEHRIQHDIQGVVNHSWKEFA